MRLFMLGFAVGIIFTVLSTSPAEAHRVTHSDCHLYVQSTHTPTYPLYQYRFAVCKHRAIKHNQSHHNRCNKHTPVLRAIHCAFGDRWYNEAVAVARCESGLRTTAVTGRFHGLFQMGDAERLRFGHGASAYEQALAARRYHRLSGWSPWSQCR